MPRHRKNSESASTESFRLPMSPEARENQMISLAIDLAEKQLREGTASSQVISHYLKLGSTKDRLEKEIMSAQRDLYMAKAKSIESNDNIEQMVKEAFDAMRLYQGADIDYEDPDIY